MVDAMAERIIRVIGYGSLKSNFRIDPVTLSLYISKYMYIYLSIITSKYMYSYIYLLISSYSPLSTSMYLCPCIQTKNMS